MVVTSVALGVAVVVFSAGAGTLVSFEALLAVGISGRTLGLVRIAAAFSFFVGSAGGATFASGAPPGAEFGAAFAEAGCKANLE